jgi:PhnB protein
VIRRSEERVKPFCESTQTLNRPYRVCLAFDHQISRSPDHPWELLCQKASEMFSFLSACAARRSRSKILPMPEPTSALSSLAPWLSLRNSRAAVEFYKAAFGAREIFRLDGGDGIVARLAVGSSEFWVSDESPEHGNFSPETLKGGTARMVLTVADPDAVFAQACQAGAQVIHPVGEQHGWRVGRVVDPFGHHWEIARQVEV